MADIELRPYQLPNDAAPDDDVEIIIDRADFVQPRKTSKTALLSNEVTARTAQDNNILAGAGLNPNGTMPSSPTSNYLRNIDFVAAGYSQDLYYGLLLLDAAINSLALSGELNVIVTLTSAEILALNGTPVLKLAAPAAGTFYHISEIIAKTNFNTIAYVTNAAGIVARFVGAGADYIVTLTQSFCQSVVTVRTKFLVQEHDIPLATGIEFFAPVADPTNGDGTIQVIFRYQLLPDFTGLAVSTSPCCIFPIVGTFVNADLTAAGNLVINHGLNTLDIRVFIMDNNGHGSQYDFDTGDEAGADDLNYVTIPIGVAAGTWRYLIMAVF